MSILDSTTFSSLLDSTLEDLADLPEFKLPPNGTHRASIVAIEEKKIGEAGCIEFRFKTIETLELADPSQENATPGSEFTLALLPGNDFFEGNLKLLLTPIARHVGVSGLREAIEAAPGMEVAIVTKTRTGKKRSEDEEPRKYLSITALAVI